MGEIIYKEADKITVPYTKEQMRWILTHVKLTRKGKKLAKAIRRWVK